MKTEEPKIIRCDRCHREINEFWSVLGYSGTYGRQCATQICQGNVTLLKRKVILIDPKDLDFEVPF